LIAAAVAVDRFGSRAAMLAGTFLATGGLLAAALVGSKVALFTTRLVGLGSAVVPVAGPGALFRAYPAAQRGLNHGHAGCGRGARGGDLAADGS
jgi:MFS family permease